MNMGDPDDVKYEIAKEQGIPLKKDITVNSLRNKQEKLVDRLVAIW